MLIQENVFYFIAIVLICVEYISECNGYHLIIPQNNVTRIKRQSNCGKNRFTCDNGQCILKHNYCDGKSDCTDESDEVVNCNTIGCPSYAFRCAYGACVNGDAKCDGKKDCRDNSDESNCGSSPNNNCGVKFGCNNGACIDKYLVCDGARDCPDGSDETYDICSAIRCQEFSFRCAYGACVDGDVKCNGIQDCVDNSDEDPKICGGTVIPTKTPDKQGCDLPSIPNGKVTVSGIGYVIGTLVKDSSVITIECNSGYKLSSNDLPKCVAGQWNIQIPNCIKKTDIIINPSGGDCAPPEIPNGKFEVLGTNLYVPGNPIPNYAAVNFTCTTPNYVLDATTSLAYCLMGKLSPKVPQCSLSCTPKFSSSIDVECQLGKVKIDCTKPVPERTIAIMKCKPHYVENYAGDSTAVCMGGSWDIPTKRCIPECGDLVGSAAPLIVEGETAKKAEFPWHVGIYRTPPGKPLGYICGGSIISVKVVLSAAHCFSTDANGDQYPISEFSIAAGKFFSNFDAAEDKDFVQKRKASKIEFPELQYFGYKQNYVADIAVVIVDAPFTLTNVIKPVCVDWDSAYVNSHLKNGAFGQIVGWGATTVKNIAASIDLKKLKIPFVDRGQCFSIIPDTFKQFLTHDKFCAGYLNGSSVCNGDSGGGLVYPQEIGGRKKFYIQGIVSVGPYKDAACDKDQIGVYTKVATYLSFVRTLETDNRVI